MAMKLLETPPRVVYRDNDCAESAPSSGKATTARFRAPQASSFELFPLDISEHEWSQANPGKYALMICVEISSVHTTFNDNINDAILHAIFADGCAASVLKGARKSECPKVRA